MTYEFKTIDIIGNKRIFRYTPADIEIILDIISNYIGNGDFPEDLEDDILEIVEQCEVKS